MRDTKKQAPRRPWLRWSTSLVVLLAAVWLWQNAQRNYHLPQELAGEWRSSDPRYADRSFELSQGYLSLGMGEGKATTGLIQEVKVSQESGKTLYAITYREDQQVNRMFFYYDSSHGQTIRFKNQPGIVWSKVPGT